MLLECISGGWIVVSNHTLSPLQTPSALCIYFTRQVWPLKMTKPDVETKWIYMEKTYVQHVDRRRIMKGMTR